MALTAFDKKAIPEDLEHIKTLIDERVAVIEAEKAKKKVAVDASDAIIKDAESELKELRIKAAEMLGIPSKLTPEEGKVVPHTEREESPAPVEPGKEKGVK